MSTVETSQDKQKDSYSYKEQVKLCAHGLYLSSVKKKLIYSQKNYSGVIFNKATPTTLEAPHGLWKKKE